MGHITALDKSSFPPGVISTSVLCIHSFEFHIKSEEGFAKRQTNSTPFIQSPHAGHQPFRNNWKQLSN